MKKQLNLILSEDLKAALEKAAKEREVSVNALIRMILKDYLKEKGLL